MNININWQPGIGDPTPIGWVTVVSYFATALICALASTRSRPDWDQPRPLSGQEKLFWIFVACFLTLLGVNKQLDLQTLFTQIGRHFAYSGGWYDQRQTVQKLFIIALSVAAFGIAITLLWMFRKFSDAVKLASIGICMLTAFIIIRAASFHHADQFLGQLVMGMRWNSILELGSIAFVAISGLWHLRNAPKIV